MAKPDLPKRLASRIRGAQRAVEKARFEIWIDGDGLAQKLARIAEFEGNPVGFAERHYRGNGPDSYPVQTNIERARESVQRKINRQAPQAAALRAADGRLVAVEAEVLAEVTAMKPSPGRVPWPKPLKSIERAFAQYQRDEARDEALYAKVAERQRLEDERVDAAQGAADALESALEDIEDFGRAAGLSRAERQELKREARAHAKEGTIVTVKFER